MANFQITKKGQSTVEYVLLATAIMAVMIAFLGPNGPLRGSIRNTLDVAAGEMTTMSAKFPLQQVTATRRMQGMALRSQPLKVEPPASVEPVLLKSPVVSASQPPTIVEEPIIIDGDTYILRRIVE
ncbi:Flp family type IVb pilin [Candidatus Omnitrophota bacterium]